MEDYFLFCSKKIRFRSEGKGNVIVLLHGFTESLEIWNEFAVSLCKSFRVICIDLPGHGKSECLGYSHSMEELAECMHALLESLNIEKPIVIGHSMGGYVALAFARKYSKNVKGLGLFHSSAYPDTIEGKANRSKVIEFISKNHSEFIMNFIPDLFTPKNREKFQNEISILVDSAKKMTKEGIIASQIGMRDRVDSSDVLKNVDFPVLFIAGKKDTRIPFDKVMEQVAMPKDTIALLLDEVAHMGYIEAKEKTLHAVKCFAQGIYS